MENQIDRPKKNKSPQNFQNLSKNRPTHKKNFCTRLWSKPYINFSHNFRNRFYRATRHYQDVMRRRIKTFNCRAKTASNKFSVG